MSRRQQAAARKAHPFRPWIVAYAHPPTEEESEGRLIAARCPSQAVRVWRERLGLRPEDIDIDELSVEPAGWSWPDVPEPACPQRPCEWSPEGKLESGVEMWRGYGFHLVDDIRCDGCDELTASERITEVTGGDGGASLCPDCLEGWKRDGAEVPSICL